MEFRVQFIGELGSYAMNIRNKETGMDGVDSIRSSDLNSIFDLSDIHPMTDGALQNPSIVLSEEQARDTCQFLVVNNIIVEVESGYLNRYAYRFISRRPLAYKDVRYQVSIKWKVNKTELIKDLNTAGLVELLHPLLNISKQEKNSLKNITLSGGIAGSYGAAIGKVFFSAEALIKAFENDKTKSIKNSAILLFSLIAF